MNRTCRFCGASLSDVVVDLGVSPLCEGFLREDQLDAMEPFYPLRVLVCRSCFLVQLPAYVSPDDIFTEYAYFSSFSTSWLEHVRRYAEADAPRVAASERTASSSKWAVTMAICCATSSPQACPCWASSRPRMSPEAAEAAGVRTLAAVLRK